MIPVVTSEIAVQVTGGSGKAYQYTTGPPMNPDWILSRL
jgi:hypothetical protein